MQITKNHLYDFVLNGTNTLSGPAYGCCFWPQLIRFRRLFDSFCFETFFCSYSMQNKPKRLQNELVPAENCLILRIFRKNYRTRSFIDVLKDSISENETLSENFEELISSWTSQRSYPILTVSVVSSHLHVTQVEFYLELFSENKMFFLDIIWK